MLFDKSEDDLKKMMSTSEKIEYELNKNESSEDYESPVVIFAVGSKGKAIMIDNPNHNKLGHGVDDMLQDEFDYGLDFDKEPGVYYAQFNWLTTRDEMEGDYDCELIVNDMVCIWKYEKE